MRKRGFIWFYIQADHESQVLDLVDDTKVMMNVILDHKHCRLFTEIL